MSALLAPVESPTRAPGDRLRSLPSAEPRLARLPFLIVLALIVAAGMVGVLVLSVNLQQRADMLSGLRAQDADLSYQEASLRARVDEVSSVTSLSQRAYRLGMVPDPAPAFINLTTGRIVGKPTRVTGRELPAQDPGAITREAVTGLQGTTTTAASGGSTAAASSRPSAPASTAAKPSSSAAAKPSSAAKPSTTATASAPSNTTSAGGH